MDDLALLILAPQARVDDGVFAWDASPAAIRRKVRRRVEDYAGERDAWFRDWFEPTCRRVEVRCLSWEEIIEMIAFHSPEAGQVIDSFYGKCLRHNRPEARTAFPGRRSGSAGERGGAAGIDRRLEPRHPRRGRRAVGPRVGACRRGFLRERRGEAPGFLAQCDPVSRGTGSRHGSHSTPSQVFSDLIIDPGRPCRVLGIAGWDPDRHSFPCAS